MEGLHHLHLRQRLRSWPSAKTGVTLWLKASPGEAHLSLSPSGGSRGGYTSAPVTLSPAPPVRPPQVQVRVSSVRVRVKSKSIINTNITMPPPIVGHYNRIAPTPAAHRRPNGGSYVGCITIAPPPEMQPASPWPPHYKWSRTATAVTPQDTSAYIRCKYTLMSLKKIKLIYKYVVYFLTNIYPPTQQLRMVSSAWFSLQLKL